MSIEQNLELNGNYRQSLLLTQVKIIYCGGLTFYGYRKFNTVPLKNPFASSLSEWNFIVIFSIPL